MANYLYNGVELPALPAWDTETYPYAYIVEISSSGAYEVTFSKYAFTSQSAYGLYALTDKFTGLRFKLSDDEWVEKSPSINTMKIRWANTDVYYADSVKEVGGTLYLAASDPIPVSTSTPPRPHLHDNGLDRGKKDCGAEGGRLSRAVSLSPISTMGCSCPILTPCGRNWARHYIHLCI